MPQCIVMYDDNAGCCVPFTWDDDCEGAICSGDGPIAVFPDRKAARKAIAISTNWARLQKSQGKVYSEDFLPNGTSYVTIRTLAPAK